MSNGLVKQNEITDSQALLIARTIAKGASPDELKLFLHQCQRTGLDPFSRQIYCIERWGYDAVKKQTVKSMSTQVAIDGLRVVAQRSNEYAGQTAPEWCGKDGKWQQVWLSDEPPAAARVGVYRKDFKEPLYAVARYSAYVQRKKATQEGKPGDPNKFWATMPDLMLSKCAEALALRKAFPQDMSGLYIQEEMGQDQAHTAIPVASETVDEATGEITETSPPADEPPIEVLKPTEKQMKLLFAKFKENGWLDKEGKLIPQGKEALWKGWHYQSRSEITAVNFQPILEFFSATPQDRLEGSLV